MSYINDTKNQHYISQAELRFNSFSAENTSNKNKKIFQFKLVDRKKNKITLTNKKGSKINTILSDYDLFTFSIVGKKDRENIEVLFKKYEEKINFHTSVLLNEKSTSENVKKSSIEIIHAKLLNSFRNPFNILNTIDVFYYLYNIENNVISTKKVKEYIDNSEKKHSKRMSSKYGVTIEEYNIWLTILISILETNNEGENILDIVIRKLLKDSSRLNLIFLYKYKKDSVLLSDTSYVTPDAGSFNENSIKYDFNISSNLFIRFASLVIPEEIKNNFKNELKYKTFSSENIKIIKEFDNMSMLSNYNKSVICQCNLTVFSATKDIYGVNIIT